MTEDREVLGILDILPKGTGYLRSIELDLQPSLEDCLVPANLIRDCRLVSGMHVKAAAGLSGKQVVAARILQMNGIAPDVYQQPVPFERQVSIDPTERFVLTPTSQQAENSMRFIELMTPLGKGQRALIVAPPRTGKTTLLHQLASSITEHHPEVYLLVLLVDERPEEVTHFKRSIRGEVIASSSDKEASSHMHIAKLTLDMARSLAESGKDVFLLLDSLTRLGRASNREEGGRGGKTLSGGMGTRALEFPRRFFGSARNLEGSGSLTIVATALIDTGSRMDEVIFQEFKGTGNCEIVLDRKIADSRLFPAVDLGQSGTRKEEKILPPDWLTASYKLRRHLATLKPSDALEVLLERLAKSASTDAFCQALVTASQSSQ